MGAKFSFCHGWMVTPGDHKEVTCSRRETCQYYSVDFYRKHGHHLDDFEEMFPFEPCEFYLAREKPVEKTEEKADFFDFMKE